VTLLARQTEQGFIEHYKPSEAVLKEMRRVLVAHDTYFNQTCYQCRVNAWRIKEHKEFERQGYKVDYKDDQPIIRRLPRIRIKKKLPL